MANGIIGIDHAVVGARDLEDTRMIFQRLGFSVTPQGRQLGAGVAHYRVMFDHDYIELVGITDASAPTGELGALLDKQGEGALAVVLECRNVRQSCQELASHGISPLAIQHVLTEIEAPEGALEHRYDMVEIPADAAPETRIALCQHITPEVLRQPAWLSHANGARRLNFIAVVVSDPESLIARCDRLFGVGSTTMTDNTLAVYTGHGALLFITPDHASVMYPGVADAARPAPYIAALGIEVGDVGKVSRVLEEAQVPFSRLIDHCVQVAPAVANGVIIEFHSRPEAGGGTTYFR